MADKKKRVVKKAETVRERSARTAKSTGKASRAKRVVRAAKKPISGAAKTGRKEFHLFKLPDNKVGRVLNKRASLMPRYFKNSWAEIKQVEWPTRKETIKLTFAVIVFAIAFGGLVFVLDYGLDKLFREVLLG